MTARRGAAACRAYLAVGLLVELVSPLLGESARYGCYVAAGVSVIVAIAHGLRRYRPAWTLPWWLLIGSVLAGLASRAWQAFDPRQDTASFLSGPMVMYSLVLLLLTLSALGWVRPLRRQGGLVEAGIVAAGAAALAWPLAVDPLLSGRRVTGPALACYLGYLCFDLVILTQTVRVALVTRVRTPAYALLVSAVGLLVGTDVTFYVLVAHGLPGRSLTTLGYLGTYLLLGGAALHPSMATSAGYPPADPTPMSPVRLVLYLALIVASGALTGRDLLASGTGPWLRVAVPIALSTAMSILLMVRLSQLAVQLNRRAQVDLLTGTGNLARLRERFGQRAAARGGALILVDLDGFRSVNDSYGHETGDDILQEVAVRLRRLAAPHPAEVLRLGGDTFAILLQRAQGDAAGAGPARVLAEAVVGALCVPYPARAGGSVLLTASVGLLDLSERQTVDDMLRRADLALLRAQRGGGDRVESYDAEMHTARLARTQLVADLRRAVADDEFTVHYQPFVHLASGAIPAAEALLRWTLPDGTRVPPDRFIPVAEQSGVILHIGAWVLGQVCAQLADWYPRHGLAVAVNVSPWQVRRPDFAETVLAPLREYGLPGTALIVELTETGLLTAVGDVSAVISRLQQLREHGVRVAIDDFGTGYSSLAYLRQLPVDVLKMDGSFTALQMSQDEPRGRALVRAILDLAGSLGLETVAEAVETAEQADRLRLLGCDLAQGYHFARPMPAAELTALLAAGAGARRVQVHPAGVRSGVDI